MKDSFAAWKCADHIVRFFVLCFLIDDNEFLVRKGTDVFQSCSIKLAFLFNLK